MTSSAGQQPRQFPQSGRATLRGQVQMASHKLHLADSGPSQGVTTDQLAAKGHLLERVERHGGGQVEVVDAHGANEALRQLKRRLALEHEACGRSPGGSGFRG